MLCEMVVVAGFEMLAWESVKMHIHLSFFYLSSATWMATSSALMMACVSS